MNQTEDIRPLFKMYRWIKRLFDVFIAAMALVVLSPLMGIVAITIYLTMGPPVLFRHVRPGYRAVPFALLKFRTMTDARDSTGRLLPDDLRLTRWGKLLRRLSLDELPQLWNVIKGEMSVVGPRPLLMQYLDRYTPQQAQRHLVKPGITGWAQVNGRNALSWEEKFALDTWYVDNRSLWLDLRILLLSVKQVIRSEGISKAGHATMPEFDGSKKMFP